ncbi:hypothetical protein CDCA_CDCA10G2988 [Cyanidium caldarium]|uniref:Protein kinase domain-containing protein n=1 Tax=Cyanidium caldarium TaxID=2771 RepID=A0AAV9IXY5_CYACA|nr:hypothetical protein CDCA_CDCA10G2988 [Cyanidium caldarium]
MALWWRFGAGVGDGARVKRVERLPSTLRRPPGALPADTLRRRQVWVVMASVLGVLAAHGWWPWSTAVEASTADQARWPVQPTDTLVSEGTMLERRHLYPDAMWELDPPWEPLRNPRWSELTRELTPDAIVPDELDGTSSEVVDVDPNMWAQAQHLRFESDREPMSAKSIDLMRVLGVSAIVGGVIVWSYVLNERASSKVRLPGTYNPSKIAAYFRWRPEQVATRAFTILFEWVRYFVGAYRDQLEYRICGTVMEEADSKKAASSNNSEAATLNGRSSPEWKERSWIWGHLWGQRADGGEEVDATTTTPLPTLRKVLGAGFGRTPEYWNWRWQRRAVLLREALERLGPAFVKLGQALATRPDIVGETSARELQRLQDDMPLFPNEEAFRFIRMELGAPPHRAFDWISENPIASASIGQVYKAQLDGVDIAVKVQRPGIVERIALDFFIVRILGSLLMRLPWALRTDLVEAIDEYASRLFEETDYHHEAENMRRFRQHYGSMPGIFVPEVYPEYSSAHVLTMEWVHGRRLVDESASVRREDIPLIKLAIACSLTQLLEDGFLHADPHAGNLLVTGDGSRLAYIDYGLMSQVPQAVQLSIICAIVHLINREYELLANDFLGLTMMHSDDLNVELPAFAGALRSVFDDGASDGNSAPADDQQPEDFTLQGMAEKLLRMTARFPFVLPPYFLNNIRALAMLEGLALNADPTFRMIDVIYPYMVHRMLTDAAPPLQTALRDFALKPSGEPRWDRIERLLRDASRFMPLNSAFGAVSNSTSTLEAAAKEAAETVMRRREQATDASVSKNVYFESGTAAERTATTVDDTPAAATASNNSRPVDRPTELNADIAAEIRDDAQLDGRRVDMLMVFIASPSGAFLRHALERQVSDDWNERWQRALDRLEARLLPARLLKALTGAGGDAPPAMNRGDKAVTRAEKTSLENRLRLVQMATHLSPSRWRILLRYAPVMLWSALRVMYWVAVRVLRRVVVDSWLIARCLVQRQPAAVIETSAKDVTASADDGENGMRGLVKARTETEHEAGAVRATAAEGNGVAVPEMARPTRPKSVESHHQNGQHTAATKGENAAGASTERNGVRSQAGDTSRTATHSTHSAAAHKGNGVWHANGASANGAAPPSPQRRRSPADTDTRRRDTPPS